jgi:hypothetical protein
MERFEQAVHSFAEGIGSLFLLVKIDKRFDIFKFFNLDTPDSEHCRMVEFLNGQAPIITDVPHLGAWQEVTDHIAIGWEHVVTVVEIEKTPPSPESDAALPTNLRKWIFWITLPTSLVKRDDLAKLLVRNGFVSVQHGES